MTTEIKREKEEMDKPCEDADVQNNEACGVVKKGDVLIKVEAEIESPRIPPECSGVKRLKVFDCEYCEFQTAYSHSLKRHTYYSHINERDIACNECEFKTTHRDYLRQHERKFHGVKRMLRNSDSPLLPRKPEKDFKCDRCDYICHSSTNLRVHILSKHPGKETKVPTCPYCEYSYPEPAAIERHLRTHSGQRPYRCDQCSFSAAQSNSLDIHKRSIHKKERPFKCDLCDYAASRRDVLTRHLLTHSGEKKFPCEICGHNLATNGERKRHMERRHVDYNRYHCQKCEYASKTKFDLKIHKQKIHSVRAKE